MYNTEVIGTLQKTVDTLCEIVREQSEIIDSIFLDLARYATQEELERMIDIEEIKEVAKKREEAGL